jgi:hypothetical protein
VGNAGKEVVLIESVVPLATWLILIARGLFQLGKASCKKRLYCADLEGGKHLVVGRPTLGILERPYGLDRPYRPCIWRLGAVPLLQRGKKRKLVRLRLPARRWLSYSRDFAREDAKGRLTRAAHHDPRHHGDLDYLKPYSVPTGGGGVLAPAPRSVRQAHTEMAPRPNRTTTRATTAPSMGIARRIT